MLRGQFHQGISVALKGPNVWDEWDLGVDITFLFTVSSWRTAGKYVMRVRRDSRNDKSVCNINQSITWNLPKNKIEDKCEGDRGMSLLFHLEMPHCGWWDLCADGPAESSVGWITGTLAGCTKWQIQHPVVYPNHTSTSQEVNGLGLVCRLHHATKKVFTRPPLTYDLCPPFCHFMPQFWHHVWVRCKIIFTRWCLVFFFFNQEAKGFYRSP